MPTTHARCAVLFLVFFLVGGCSSSAPPAPGKVVGAAGGSVSSSDGKVTLDIPAGALASDVRIDIEPSTSFTEQGLVGGTLYDLTPDGTAFAKPVTATFRYDPARLPAGGSESGARLFKFLTNGQRLADPSTVDTAAHAVTAELRGFSNHGVICCNPPATPPNLAASWDPATQTVHLTWGAVPPGAFDTGLVLDRAIAASPAPSDYQPLITLSPTAVGYDDPGSSFQPGAVIWYRLTGVFGSVSAVPAVVSVQIPNPQGGGGQRIYVTGYGSGPSPVGYIARMDDIQGNGWTPLFGNSAGTDRFNRPYGIAVDGSGAIYVTDGARVVRTDITGSSWQVLYGQDGGTDHFTGLEGIAVDAAGNVYLTDWGGIAPGVARVIMTDMTGNTWKVLGGAAGSGTGQFNLPGQIAIDSQFLYVAERGNGRVVQTTITGTPWNVLTQNQQGTDHFVNPRGVAIAPDGAVIVADEGGDRIIRASMSGAIWVPLSAGTGLPSPTNVAAASDGTIDAVSYRAAYLAQLPDGGDAVISTTLPDGGAFYGVAVGP